MGIIDGQHLKLDEASAQQLRLESDVIFGCVFLGFMCDALQRGVVLRWDVEPVDPSVTDSKAKADQQAEKNQQIDEMQAVISRLRMFTGMDAKIEVGLSPQYDAGGVLQVAIAATQQLSDAASEQTPTTIPWSSKIAAYVRTTLLGNTDLMGENLDKEFGAYYGIVDASKNTTPKVISSVRRLIPYNAEGGRWKRGVAYHGLIGYDGDQSAACKAPKQAGSIEPTALISAWNGRDHVCGYCHGMVWAVAEVHCDFPDGRPFELALGKNTRKLSSCFGCSTFLHANDYAPSSMHLGRSESWVPLPDGPNATAPFSTDKTKEALDREIFAALNQRWAKRVADWLTAGASLVVLRRDEFLPVVVNTGSALITTIRARPDPRSIANLFLDALTVHEKDLTRLKRFVGI
jgi:hypothetical protein